MKYFLFFLCITASLQAQQKVVKTEKQWKNTLTPQQYYILRQKGTEYAFSGTYDKHYKKGTYHCAACNTPLFTSDTKFNSGTGWPSFDNHIGKNVGLLKDTSHHMVRTEIICNVCDGHLGHLFLDGPTATSGKRYCVNSLALKFVKNH